MTHLDPSNGHPISAVVPATSTPRRPAAAAKSLPDIAQDTTARVQGRLDRVGMSGIEIPVKVRAFNNELSWTPGRASAYVSLDDPTAKGIHMSRLFLALNEAMRNQELHLAMLPSVLRRFVQTHAPLSRSSVLEVEYQQMVERPALLSENAGWRSYPVRLTAELSEGQTAMKLWFRLVYSSTCPCSAALSRKSCRRNSKRPSVTHRWTSPACRSG